ncbi:MAG: hypothetical protein JSV16_14655 [Candidatus Hydrogenedentota bacterium]|nr:MAG: hypothetical protein JSV16_14655 [Candidatus Hydrogenedentota bacterium]
MAKERLWCILGYEKRNYRTKKYMFQSTIPVFLRFFLVGFIAAAAPAGKLVQPQPIEYDQPRRLGVLADNEINESSGLARSLLNPDAFWTHNDSGDIPRLFLINREGRTLATFVIEGAQAVDWEDIASFRRGTRSYLLIGDIGDNSSERSTCTLYVVPEPRISKNSQEHVDNLRPSITISFTYEDGPHDCESLAVDPINEMVYLVSKEDGGDCRVYELSLPKEQVTKPLIARTIATLKIFKATAMDISSDGFRAIVLTYLNAYEYVRGTDKTWAETFARPGRVLTMPLRQQGESICYGTDGKTLYLTSEGVSQPLWEVPIASDNEHAQLGGR